MTLPAALLGVILLGQAQVSPIVVDAERAWARADVLWRLASSDDAATRRSGVRAIGRLEDPANVPRLLALAPLHDAPSLELGWAISQSLNGFDPAKDPGLLSAVSTWLRAVTFLESSRPPFVMAAPIGRIHWATAEQVHAAEAALTRILEYAAHDKSKAAIYLAAVQSLESLGRLNTRVTPFDAATVSRLSRIVANSAVNDGDGARETALAALIAARALDSETELVALRDPYEQVRRQATAVLAAGGAGLDNERRLDLIQEKLRDPHGQVRYEAVKGYARRGAEPRGCSPLLAMLGDRDSHVALAAIDALGEVCKDDEDVTTRIIAEAVTPVGLTWHRGAHAFVALAKRAPDRAALSMNAFVTHPNWWVRMYAARAAGAAGDVARLEKLAYDANDNVREAALGPLRRLTKGDADPAIVDALGRTDVQLLRRAAMLLKAPPRSEQTARALVAALQRLTREGKETSRDARVALLEALAIHADAANALELQPLLKDFDPVVAAKAASLLTQLTGIPATAEPLPVRRGRPQQVSDLKQCLDVSLDSGKSFTLLMDPSAAPVTVSRFLELALVDRYYDGLTIHRVAPNFVIQGGGPGANEYSGHKEYMRDEIGARNSRGTVGLSTRGRNTADAQFFINLIDNARLDLDYTVFARVRPADMETVNAIEEGAVMRRISSVQCPAR
jgi:cyclophilin family peptidyl-prolyl cis-trans isomerase/HEAT repeat protein